MAELAFEYARAVVALRDVSDATKNEALAWLSQRIVPLVGALSFEDLDDRLKKGVAHILGDETDAGASRLVFVWWDFMRWTDIHLWLRGRGGSQSGSP